MGLYYVNPLGDVIDISYNYLKEIKEKSLTRIGQLEDSEIKLKSQNIQLTIWTIFAAIFLLIAIVYLRNVNKF